MVAAGDTFRAAAEEQLDIWSQRAGADIGRNDGADPASVVFDAIKKAKNRILLFNLVYNSITRKVSIDPKKI